MALTIIPKYSGDPLEPASSTRRLSVPSTYAIQGVQGVQGVEGPQGVQGPQGSCNPYVNINSKTSDHVVDVSDLNNTIEASGTFSIYLPINVSVGYQTTILNVGNGTITISPSTGAIVYSTSSLLDLTDQYSAASVLYKGSNIWSAFGNLK